MARLAASACAVPTCPRRAEVRGRCRRHAAEERSARYVRNAELLYGRAWKRSARAFLRGHPACVACGAIATVVDHERPHRGSLVLFWDVSNWGAYCKYCHDRKTATRDRGFGDKVGRYKSSND